MFFRTFSCLFLSLSCILNTVDFVNARNLAKPCQVRLICSKEEDVVYATEGEQCHVFLNACELRNENCVRHNFFFKTLEPLKAEICQKMCQDNCGDETQKVCAVYNDEERTFNSYCEWNLEVCRTGKMYSKPTQGECGT